MSTHPTCPRCGSPNIRAKAYASWDPSLSGWVITITYEDYFCPDCEAGDIEPIWKEDEA